MAGLLIDNACGIEERLHFDDTEGTFTRQLVQDVDPILNDTKRLANEHNAGKNQDGDFYLAGRFPQVLVEDWLKKRGLTMRDFKGDVVKEFLNDKDHSYFRVWQGRV